jgi:hypothetical protein
MMSLGKEIKVRLENKDDLMEADLMSISDAVEEFERKVHEMRREQKAFFDSKPGGEARQEHLKNSKRLEREIDQMLHSMGYDEQKALF